VFVALLLALFSTGPTVQAQIPELVIGIGVDADTLNPQEQTTSLIINLCDLLYDDLFYAAPDGKLEPRLATKVDVSKDGLTYTLHLRKGVKFSDGTPFDAKVMKLTVDRALDPKMKVPQRYLINMIQESKIVDDYTLDLVLKFPYAPFVPTLLTSSCPLFPGGDPEIRRGCAPEPGGRWSLYAQRVGQRR